MSSYLNYQQSIIDAGVLEVAKRIGLNPTIFDSEVMSQHYADHQGLFLRIQLKIVRCDVRFEECLKKLLKQLENILSTPVAEGLI